MSIGSWTKRRKRTLTCKTTIFHLHVPVRELWVFNKGFYMQNQHLSISTFQYVSYGSWTKRKKTKKTSRSYATIYFYMQNQYFSSPRSSTWAMVLQHNDRAKTEPRASTFWLGEKSRKVWKMNKSPSSTVKKTCILTHTHIIIFKAYSSIIM